MTEEIPNLLQEIETILREQPINWTPMEMPPKPEFHDAHGYQGKTADWSFIVVDFDIEPQGFPPGSRGHDGTALHGQRGIIMRLTRELAKLAFERAANI